jgi:hypothetical protein
MRNRLRHCCLAIAEGAIAGYFASAAVWIGISVSTGF